ncbi:MAG TPA: hypothetical protein VII80_05130, partial [Pseudolabrys sp.]
LPHRELHRGQRPMPAAMKAGHMNATEPSTKNVQQHLDPQGPSTHEKLKPWQFFERDCATLQAVIAREGGRPSIPERQRLSRNAAAYWIPRFRWV